MAPPSPHLSHPSNELSPPSSPIPSLPPLDLTPPTQNMSPPLSPIPSLPPLDLTPPTQIHLNQTFPIISFDLNYDDTDDDYGIPFEWPPSRPMVNYRNDGELEEDYKIGWEWLEHDTGLLIAPCTGFQQCLVNPLKQNLKTLQCFV